MFVLGFWVFFFFFFKQKTAYEMSIGDWSSDVCSSDLRGLHRREHIAHAAGGIDAHAEVEPRRHRRRCRILHQCEQEIPVAAHERDLVARAPGHKSEPSAIERFGPRAVAYVKVEVTDVHRSLQPRLFQEIAAVRRTNGELRQRAVASDGKWNLDTCGTEAPHLAKHIGKAGHALARDFDDDVAEPRT